MQICHWAHVYRIYSNKRRGAYLIFRATRAPLIWGWHLFKNCTRQIYFFYIYIRRYTLYQFLRTDTKLIVNGELREKFMRWKNPESFITRVKLSAVRATSFVVVEQLTIYNVQLILMSLSPHRGCGAYSRAVLINFFVPDAALIRGQLLFKGGAYSSKYSMQVYSFSADMNCTYVLVRLYLSCTVCWGKAKFWNFQNFELF